MEKSSAPLYECHVNTNEGTDTFVGIRSDGDQIKVCFPLGYKLGTTEADQKKGCPASYSCAFTIFWNQREITSAVTHE